MSNRRHHNQEVGLDTTRGGRRSRNSFSRLDTSSLATVRELLKEIHRLEDEIDSLAGENEDLIYRYEHVLRENEMLRRDLGIKGDDAPMTGPDMRTRWTPKSNPRRTWEELEERESTRATVRNRSSGQRSGGSSVRNVRYSDGEESGEATSFPRRISDNSVRKSSAGHSVAFERDEEIITVPVTGAMRPSRSRVSTPFFNEETVNRMTQKTAPQVVASDDEEERHSSVNFERDVHVVEVPLGTDDCHHSRSVRGRIATPFIRDVPTADDSSSQAPPQ